MKKPKVLLNVDTGVDDAQALLLALRSPDLEVVGITTVAGNVDVDQVTANTLKVLDIADAPEIPVAKGMSHPLVEPTRYVPEIHGQNGLGNLNPPPSSRSLADVHAVEFLIETLMAADEPITLVPLAPLTNVGVALRVEPRIKEKIEQVVLMGGSAFAGGNATQWAEANIFYDPEAAHILFTSGLPIIMYGWDVYVQVGFARHEVQAFVDSPNPWAQFAARLMQFELDNFGLGVAYIGDAGAVAAVIQPEGLTTRHMHVAVELQGAQTRGMTVVDPRGLVIAPDKLPEPPNVHVGVAVDVEAYKRLFRETLLA